MSRFVRASKFRHVFGQDAKPEKQYLNVGVTRSAWDSNYICANRKYMSIVWQAGGGGAVGVWDLSRHGKLPAQNMPLINGHKQPVLDTAWHPFNDDLLASAAEDGYIKLWQIPEGGLTENMETPVQTLIGHKRKVGTVNFHPSANNVLASTSTDYSVRLWDIEKGEERSAVEGHSDIINCFDWNQDGSQALTSCKDKKIRVFDARTNTIGLTFDGHQGVKGNRGCWLDSHHIFTVGFSKTTEREYMVWDIKNTSQPLHRVGLDTSSGVIMPFYDWDTKVLYLAGKGDGNIRYFEYVAGDATPLYSLSEYKSSVPARGACLMPKTSCEIPDCEIARFLKLTTNSVLPISMTVPRKSDAFQDDIFPDTSSGSGEAAHSADSFFKGNNKMPVFVSLEKGFVAKPKAAAEFVAKVADDGPKGEAELRKAFEEQKKRVSYLEAELTKAQLRVKELGG